MNERNDSSAKITAIAEKKPKITKVVDRRVYTTT